MSNSRDVSVYLGDIPTEGSETVRFSYVSLTLKAGSASIKPLLDMVGTVQPMSLGDTVEALVRQFKILKAQANSDGSVTFTLEEQAP